jgi:Na+/H+-dicarboxylate symporter
LLGNMWIKTLKMIVLPFMLTNMSTSVAETKMLKNTGGLAKITFMWYIATTCAACVMGITMGSLFLLPTIEKHDSVNNTSTGNLEADPVMAPATIIDRPLSIA